MVENRKSGAMIGRPDDINNMGFMSSISNLRLDYETLKIVSNIFIAFIGSGVLGLPYAFKRSGLLEGAFVMAVVAFFSTRAMLLLIDCQYKVRSVLQNCSSSSNKNIGNATNSKCTNGLHNGVSNKKRNPSGGVLTEVIANGDETEPFEDEAFVEDESSKCLISNGEKNGWQDVKYSREHSGVTQEIITYSDVAFAAWGEIGRLIIDGSLICAQVGFCCGYLIFITENLSNYYTSVTKTSWLVVLLPPLFFLTLIPDLRKLAIFSLMAQMSNLMAFAVVFWFDFEHLHLANAIHRKEISLKGFPFFFCAAVYCFEGAGMVLSLEQSVLSDRRIHFKKYFVATIGNYYIIDLGLFIWAI